MLANCQIFSPCLLRRGPSALLRRGRLSQRAGCPVRHDSHSPQKIDGHEMIRSPGLTYRASGPTFSTNPVASWPSTVAPGSVAVPST